jgi:hypothetical protein
MGRRLETLCCKTSKGGQDGGLIRIASALDGSLAVPTGLGAQGAQFVYLSGVFGGQIDFAGPSPLVSLGQNDFLAKLLLP